MKEMTEFELFLIGFDVPLFVCFCVGQADAGSAARKPYLQPISGYYFHTGQISKRVDLSG